MQHQLIGSTPLRASRIAQGCMAFGGVWQREPSADELRQRALGAVHAALEQGITLFDHADIYWGGRSEELFSAIWSEVAGLRERVILQSKCSIRPPKADDLLPTVQYDFSAEHILRSVEGSLRRLKTDYLDILLLHRPDALVEPEEVAQAFSSLRQSGKVRYFGVSNSSAAQIELLRHALDMPIEVNQIDFSLRHADLIEAGIRVNQTNPSSWVQGEGLIEYCRLHQITLQAYGPLAQGRLTGEAQEGDEHLLAARQLIQRLAEEKQVSGAAIVLAWILRHPANIQPVIGTTNPQRIADACQADQVNLSREEWYALFTAVRGQYVP